MEKERIDLEKPYEFEGQIIEYVELSDLDGRDFMDIIRETTLINKSRGIEADPSAIEMAALLLAKAAGLPFEAVESMPIKDFAKLTGRYVPLVTSLIASSGD